ncbi:unnamed protein product, partial [Polarella glacialis]
MVNAIWIWIDTDYNDSPSLLQSAPIFQVMENAFCFYFSFEWVTRFMAFKVKRNGMKDAWFIFDTCLVGMMVAETWIMTIAIVIMGGGSLSLGGAGSLLRMLRL